VLHEWTERDKYFEIIEKIPGDTLEDAWPSLEEEDIARIAKEAAELLGQLRGLTSDRMESLGGQPRLQRFLLS
jgi:hypothetical protein